MLLVNKLAYLTHLTSAESISDREVQVLLGGQPQLDGLLFNCCDALHSDTPAYLLAHCPKLKALSLRRFARLTDGLLEDLVSALVRLERLDLSTPPATQPSATSSPAAPSSRSPTSCAACARSTSPAARTWTMRA